MSRIGEGPRGRKITDMSFILRDVNSMSESESESDIKHQTGGSLLVRVMQGEVLTVQYRTTPVSLDRFLYRPPA
jgi:hypothetical protein